MLWPRLEGGGQHGDALLGFPITGREASQWSQHPVPHLGKHPASAPLAGSMAVTCTAKHAAFSRPCLCFQCVSAAGLLKTWPSQ